jgi:hypothetical protein
VAEPLLVEVLVRSALGAAVAGTPSSGRSPRLDDVVELLATLLGSSIQRDRAGSWLLVHGDAFYQGIAVLHEAHVINRWAGVER